jgi:hypothetical protein
VLVAPQEDCIFKVTVCARETFGMATAAAAAAPNPVAPVKNLRRDVDFRDFISVVVITSQLKSRPWPGRFAPPSTPLEESLARVQRDP